MKQIKQVGIYAIIFCKIFFAAYKTTGSVISREVSLNQGLCCERQLRDLDLSASYAAVIFCVEKIFDYDDSSDHSYKKPEEMEKIFGDKQLKRGKSVPFSLSL